MASLVAVLLAFQAVRGVVGLVGPAPAPRRPALRSKAAAVEELDLERFLATRPAAKAFYDDIVTASSPAAAPAAPEPTLEEQTQLSALVDYLHTELMKLSPLADYEDKDGNQPDDVFDDFVAEGRKMLSISASRVCHGDDRAAVSGAVWEAVAGLLADPTPDTGLLCALPEYVGDARAYLDDEVVAPLALMGFGDTVEATAYRVAGGAPCPAFRLLVSPSAPPEDGAPDPTSLFGE